MIPYTKVINGITRYIDDEIVNKLAGLQKWAVGTAAGIMLAKGTDMFNGLKTSPLIKSMGIINENDEVDVELIYRELKKQAQKGAVTFDIPLLGALTLNEQDVDKLYNKIIGG